MSEYSSLCPGYKQVQAFGPDDEYDEEETTYVTLDLGSADSMLISSSSQYRLIGLDTPTPFLQLSGTVFKGRHDSLLGTELLFTDGKDAGDWSKRSITHVANTEQRIAFKEVQLKPKSVARADEKRMPHNVELDRITGKIGPVQQPTPRTRREKKKGAAAEESVDSEKQMNTDS
ncbi:hypothetical protein GGX14DRAFT_634882 [Mycena pura]|uniref:Transcription factor TFIIIC triple barrel domain-containing protein n=1 Tax=Mycena pura TaxID=153505 RepID=A0AAD6VB86_9AGAR|nr:hypothetical protein GGX14DRAFT_634882 [Mycena pura]